jgi:hypothetical protein
MMHDGQTERQTEDRKEDEYLIIIIRIPDQKRPNPKLVSGKLLPRHSLITIDKEYLHIYTKTRILSLPRLDQDQQLIDEEIEE